jgi:putative proteasome-type protease
MNYDASLKSAMRAILISFDSTIRSNLSVGMPIDVLVYHNDSLQMPQGYRIDENDEYFASIRQHWSDGLRKILNELEDSPVSYWQ